MPANAYTQLAVASIAMAAGLFVFSDSFAVAILAFGLLMVGSVALGFAADQANQA